ncbi:hypothetical protein Tco_0383485 [Tanacetum coccineum]
MKLLHPLKGSPMGVDDLDEEEAIKVIEWIKPSNDIVGELLEGGDVVRVGGMGMVMGVVWVVVAKGTVEKDKQLERKTKHGTAWLKEQEKESQLGKKIKRYGSMAGVARRLSLRGIWTTVMRLLFADVYGEDLCNESLTFNVTVAQRGNVISKWKAELKDDMDARSDVYVLSNGCRKCSDDNNVYYWEYTPGMFIHLFLYIDGMVFLADARLKSGLPRSKVYNGKSVQTLLEGHSILSLEVSLSGDCDVEKNRKWSCIYEVGSQEYQMVCTRLDIASADVGMLDKFDRGLQTDVQVFVDFDYTMGRSITVMGRSITRGYKVGYLAKGTRNRVRIQAKDSSGYCYRWDVEGEVGNEVGHVGLVPRRLRMRLKAYLYMQSKSQDELGVTHTDISSPFEGLSDIGSPGVVVPEHEGLPWMLDDPHTNQIFVPKPYLAEYMPQEDEVFPAEEQPLPAAASPTTQSPDYVPESDPEADPEEDDDEDPEDDPVDYHADRRR